MGHSNSRLYDIHDIHGLPDIKGTLVPLAAHGLPDSHGGTTSPGKASAASPIPTPGL